MKSIKFPLFSLIFPIIIALYCTQSIASAVISGTRVIYPSDKKDVSVSVKNNGERPILLQNWIDTGNHNQSPDTLKVPFILTPPINRVDAGKGQTLRISYTGAALPTDRESVFWLNVLEIPQKNAIAEETNALQVAFRSRIKLFFRPGGLQGNANDAAKAVFCTVAGNGVEVRNPTPYYINFVNLTSDGKKVESPMMAPYSSVTLGTKMRSGQKIDGSFINDYGAMIKYTTNVK